uniref:Uncharacterized protein n=1 Tax=Arundo donax TaxID=35708 RepID=A0A0A9T7V1_ARUDO
MQHTLGVQLLVYSRLIL